MFFQHFGGIVRATFMKGGSFCRPSPGKICRKRQFLPSAGGAAEIPAGTIFPHARKIDV
jgi:hypothetical protein